MVVDVMIVHAARHGSPTRPALSILFGASLAVQSAPRRAPEVELLPVRFLSVTQYQKFGETVILKVNPFDNEVRST